MQAILSTAAGGLNTALARFEASARRTAENPTADPGGEAVERLQAELGVIANVQVIRAADRMMKSLLDIRA